MKLLNILGVTAFIYSLLYLAIKNSDFDLWGPNGFLIFIVYPPLVYLMLASGLVSLIGGIVVFIQSRKFVVGSVLGLISLLLIVNMYFLTGVIRVAQ